MNARFLRKVVINPHTREIRYNPHPCPSRMKGNVRSINCPLSDNIHFFFNVYMGVVF